MQVVNKGRLFGIVGVDGLNLPYIIGLRIEGVHNLPVSWENRRKKEVTITTTTAITITIKRNLTTTKHT